MEIFPTLSNFPIISNEMKYRYYEMKSLCNPDDPFYEKTHFHAVYEFYINIEGNLSFHAGNQIYPISKGDIIVCRPSELHNCIYNEATVHRYRCLWIYFEPGSEFEKHLHNLNFKQKYSFDRKTNEKIDALFSTFTESSIAEQKIRIHTFLSLLFENENIAEQTLAPIPKHLKNAIEYINNNYAEIKSISEVADNCYISIPTINRLFRKYLSTTPSDFINVAKLAAAKQFLEDGYSVTDACIQSGFSNCSYFITLFKNQYGTTPHKYKSNKR